MTAAHSQEPRDLGGTRTYRGGCHCGAVRFEAELDLSKGATRCNCSMCTRVADSAVVVKPEAFRLLSGAESLTEYRRGQNPNARWFCKGCGSHCFARGYVEQIGGSFVSVNINCLDDVELRDVKIGYWDGRHDNWAAGTRDEPWPIRG